MTVRQAHKIIMAALLTSMFEETQSIYMKEPVKVGTDSKGKDVLCTYVSKSSEGGFYLNIIFDEVSSKLYGNNYEFTFASFETPNGKFKGFTREDKAEGLTLDKNALILIAESLNTWGNEWILEQRLLRVRSRYFNRVMIQKSYDYKKKPTIVFSWAEELEMTLCRAKIEDLMWNRQKNHDMNTYNEMIRLGEVAYNAKQKHGDKRMRKMLKGLTAKLIKNKFGGYVK